MVASGFLGFPLPAWNLWPMRKRGQRPHLLTVWEPVIFSLPCLSRASTLGVKAERKKEALYLLAAFVWNLAPAQRMWEDKKCLQPSSR